MTYKLPSNTLGRAGTSSSLKINPGIAIHARDQSRDVTTLARRQTACCASHAPNSTPMALPTAQHTTRRGPLLSAAEYADEANIDKNFHLVLHSVYRAPTDATGDQLQRLEALTLRRLDQLNAESLITVMFAFARTAHLPADEIVQRFQRSTAPALPSLTPRHLQHACFSMRRLVGAGAAQAQYSWLGAFSQALDIMHRQLEPSALVDLLVAAADVGVQPTHSTLEAVLEAVRKEYDSSVQGQYWHVMGAPHVARALWVMGHYNCGAGTAAAARRAAEAAAAAAAAGLQLAAGSADQATAGTKLDSGDPGAAPGNGAPKQQQQQQQQTPHTAPGSTTQLNCDDVVVQGEFLIACCMDTLHPDDLAMAAHGLAALGAVPSAAWVQRLLTVSRSKLGSVSSCRQLAMLAYAVAKMGAQPPAAWTALVTLAVEDHMQRPGSRSRDVVRAVSALAAFGALLSPPVIAAYVAAHAEEIQPRELQLLRLLSYG